MNIYSIRFNMQINIYIYIYTTHKASDFEGKQITSQSNFIIVTNNKLRLFSYYHTKYFAGDIFEGNFL